MTPFLSCFVYLHDYLANLKLLLLTDIYLGKMKLNFCVKGPRMSRIMHLKETHLTNVKSDGVTLSCHASGQSSERSEEKWLD